MPNPKPGDAGYGSAPEGSLSEERAKKAAVWVEKEVFKLLGEIEALGRSSGSHVEVTFGELFIHYQDVSDTLVGIMARAKKRGLIAYEGEGGQMLFQGKHDHVVVRLDKQKSDVWRKEYLSGQSSASPSSAPASAEKKAAPTVKEQFEEEKKRRVQSSSAVKSSPPAHVHHSAPIETPPPAPRPMPVPLQTKPEPAETKTPEPTGSHAGFLATMMGKLLPTSPKGSPDSEASVASTPPHQPQQHSKPPVVQEESSMTKSIMANLSKLLPSSASSESLDDGVLRAVKTSASLKRNETNSSETKREDPPAGSVTNTREIPVLHAALPQRTRDGTRGAVLKTPPSPPKAARPVSVIAQKSTVSAPAKPVPNSPPSSATLKRDQEDWAKKHMSRGVVAKTASTTGASGSAYSKLAQFQDAPVNAGAPKHKSVPPPSGSVSKVAGAYEKSKQSSTLPTGLQRRFAWE